LNIAFRASQGLRTIDGNDKLRETETLEKACAAIDRAERIYILGYGFDEFNSARLDLPHLLQLPLFSREIMFTNFGGLNRVSKSASRVMLGNFDSFPPYGKPFVVGSRGLDQHGSYQATFEVSEKNVYDALEQDFESFEKDS
jgi:hypothetical protein